MKIFVAIVLFIVSVSQALSVECARFFTHKGIPADALLDKQNNLWVGLGFWNNVPGSVCLFDGKQCIYYDTNNTVMKRANVYSMALDPNNNLYINAGGNLCIYDGIKWTSIIATNDFIYNKKIEIDIYNNLWCCTTRDCCLVEYNGIRSVFYGDEKICQILK